VTAHARHLENIKHCPQNEVTAPARHPYTCYTHINCHNTVNKVRDK